MQSYANVLGGFVRERAYVDVGFVTVAQAKLDRDLDEFVDALWQLHREDLRRRREALVMIAHQYEKELTLLRHPVPPNSFEAAGSVLEPVRQQPDLRVFVFEKTAVRVDGDARKV